MRTRTAQPQRTAGTQRHRCALFHLASVLRGGEWAARAWCAAWAQFERRGGHAARLLNVHPHSRPRSVDLLTLGHADRQSGLCACAMAARAAEPWQHPRMWSRPVLVACLVRAYTHSTAPAHHRHPLPTWCAPFRLASGPRVGRLSARARRGAWVQCGRRCGRGMHLLLVHRQRRAHGQDPAHPLP